MDLLVGTVIGGLLYKSFRESSPPPLQEEKTTPPDPPRVVQQRQVDEEPHSQPQEQQPNDEPMPPPPMNEVDSEYVDFYDALRSEEMKRKAAVKQQLKRMQDAEPYSEVTRVLKIVDGTPCADRVAQPGDSNMRPGWMGQMQQKRTERFPTQLLPLPPPDDILGQRSGVRQEIANRSLIKGLVTTYGNAGTSNYKREQTSTAPVWDHIGTGTGQLYPAFSRPSFKFERTDQDTVPLPPSQTAPIKGTTYRDGEQTGADLQRSLGMKVDFTGPSSGLYVASGSTARAAFQLPLKDTTVVATKPLGVGLAVHDQQPSSAVYAEQRARPEYKMLQSLPMAPARVAFTLGTDRNAEVRFTDDALEQDAPGPNTTGAPAKRTAAGALSRSDGSQFQSVEELEQSIALLSRSLQQDSGQAQPGAAEVAPLSQTAMQAARAELEQSVAALARSLKQESGQAQPGAADVPPLSKTAAQLGRAELEKLTAQLANALSRVSEQKQQPVQSGETRFTDDTGIGPHTPEGRAAKSSLLAPPQTALPRLVEEPYQAPLYQMAGLATHLTSLGTRGEAPDLRQVDRTQVNKSQGLGKNLGAALPEQPRDHDSQLVQDPKRQHVETADAARGKATVSVGFTGARQPYEHVDLGDSKVMPDRVILPRREAGGAAPETEHTLKGNSNQYTVGSAVVERPLFVHSNPVLAPLSSVGGSRATVKDLLLQRRARSIQPINTATPPAGMKKHHR